MSKFKWGDQYRSHNNPYGLEELDSYNRVQTPSFAEQLSMEDMRNYGGMPDWTIADLLKDDLTGNGMRAGLMEDIEHLPLYDVMEKWVPQQHWGEISQLVHSGVDPRHIIPRVAQGGNPTKWLNMAGGNRSSLAKLLAHTAEADAAGESVNLLRLLSRMPK